MTAGQKFSYWVLLICFAVFGWATKAREDEIAQNVAALANSMNATQSQISDLHNQIGQHQ